MKFFETSAKDGTNVKESFGSLARDVVESLLNSGMITGPGGVPISSKAATEAKKKGCTIM